MINPSTLVQTLINGVLIGGIYGLTALGLGLIWGVMKVVNIAHGTFIMLGAFLSYWAFALFGLNPLISLAIAFPVGLVFGFLIYWLSIDRIIKVAANDFAVEMMTLLFTFALSLVIYGSALNAWGGDLRGIPLYLPTWFVGGFAIPTSRLIVVAAALAFGALLYWFLKHTYFGKAIRAVTQSREAAMLLGINPVLIFGISFSIGTAYAMIAGVALSMITPITPDMGFYYLLKSFTVVVLGGLGNPLGVFLAGLILGLAESATTLFASFALSPAVAFILLLLVLFVKPTGIFGEMR